MNNYTRKTLITISLALMSSVYFTAQARAENQIDWRIEGNAGGQYNSNLAQIEGFPGDFINSYTATGTFRYLSPGQTQVLARVQGQYNKYINLSDFDVAVFAGSLTVSQWLFNSLNIYAGLQPIKLVSLSNSKSPFDMVYLGGLTYYYPIEKDLLFGGYQLDRLNAESEDFRAWNNTLYFGYRHPFTDNFIGNAVARVRHRNLDNIPDELRYNGNINVQYIINPWLTLQLGGDYTQITSAAQERNLGFFNFGLNIIGGYNSSLRF